MGPAKEALDSYRTGLPKGDELGYEHLREHAARLRTIGRGATVELMHFLRYSNDWRMRLLAVRALRKIADPAAIPALVHALGDAFYGDVFLQRMGVIERAGYAIRHEATEALASLGPTGHEALLAMARDPKHPEQERAVRGLVLVKVPGRVPALIELASDRQQRTAVRAEAVDGLTLEAEGAQEALAALLADEALRDRVETALVRSRDRDAIDPLFVHVRKAAVNCELARRAAETIASIDDRWRPKKVQDAVDYLLFSADLSKIKKELADPALPRLKQWASSRTVPMKLAAKEALAAYRTHVTAVRRKAPSPPPPKPRPVRRG